MQLMAQSGINVVGLEEGLLHSGGQQTFLNAMAMGKPVIVTDPEGAEDYICNGIDGLLVPPGDPEKLRSAILKLQKYPGLSIALGEKAREKTMTFDTETHLSAIASLAKKICLEG
jgi:glycosyltransferase involved in cell wall biosynthesis